MDTVFKAAAVAAASWGANRIDISKLDSNFALLHSSWSGSSWSSWESLGGTFNSLPSATCWGPDRVDVIGTGNDNGAWYKWYQSSSSSWSAWESHGGTFASGQLSVTSISSESLHILGVGTDGQAWHQSDSNGAWGNYESLGGDFKTSTSLTANAWSSSSSSSSSVTIDFAGVGADRACHHKHYSSSSSSSSTSSWSSWCNRGGSFVTDVQILSVSSTQIDLVGIGPEWAVHHSRYDGKSWSEWKNIGGSWTSKPALIDWGNGRFHAFGVGDDKQMHYKTFNESGWGKDWSSIGGSFSSAPTIVSTSDGFHCLGIGTDSSIKHKA